MSICFESLFCKISPNSRQHQNHASSNPCCFKRKLALLFSSGVNRSVYTGRTTRASMLRSSRSASHTHSSVKPSENDTHLLLKHLGKAAKVKDLSREELFNLKVLSTRPFGLRSARLVARHAGISPSTALKLLNNLKQRGMVDNTAMRGWLKEPSRKSTSGFLAKVPTG